MSRLRSILAYSLALFGSITVQGEEPLRPFLENYCVECHRGRNPEAGVRLETDDLAGEFAEHRMLWAEVLEQLENEEMPPEAPFPTSEERAKAIASVSERLASIDFEALRKVEPAPIRRLTKTEYRNTIRDLFGMELRAGEYLPPETEGASGFRNDRNAITTSASEMEHFFESAERAVDGWIGPDTPLRFSNEAENWTRSTSDVMPFRNGIVLVHPDHEIENSVSFPVDGVYEFRLQAAAFENRCVASIRIGDEVIAEQELPRGQWSKAREITLTAFVPMGIHSVRVQSKNLVPQVPLPPDAARLVAIAAEKNAPQLSVFSNETNEIRQARETLNKRSVAIQEPWEWLRLLGPNGDPREIDRFRRYTRDRDEAAEEDRKALIELAKISRVDFNRLWLEQNREQLEDRASLATAIAGVRWDDWMKHQGRLFIDRIEVAGPIFPKNRLRPNGRDTVSELLPLAFRREVSEAELARYEEFFDTSKGNDQEKLRSTVIAILLSPEFLYRTSDEATGSRLSYFLWQSKPDSEVNDVDLMLDDPRAEAFFSTFSEDWLGIENLGTSIMPDRAKFPEFTEETATRIREEAIAAVRQVFRPGGNLLELINGDQPVQELPAVLTVTSSPGRTNPVRRGAWVLDRLLGDPPGEALPNAGQLSGDAGSKGESLKEELKRHRDDPTCARCHEKIDPLGFILESYDPLGRLRDVAPDPEFGGPEELRKMLSDRKTEVTQNLTRRMLSFAIGRQLTVHDEATVQEIAKAVEESGYEARELIRQIAKCDLFLSS